MIRLESPGSDTELYFQAANAAGDRMAKDCVYLALWTVTEIVRKQSVAEDNLSLGTKHPIGPLNKLANMRWEVMSGPLHRVPEKIARTCGGQNSSC